MDIYESLWFAEDCFIFPRRNPLLGESIRNMCLRFGEISCSESIIYIYLRAAAPAADPGSKYGGLATFGYLLKQGNLGTNLRNISK